MKCKSLPFILLWLIATVANAQITGSTTYDLCEGSIISSSSTSPVTVDDDNALTFSDGSGSSFSYHGTSHGVHFFESNTISMKVASLATITFSICEYGTEGATWDFTDESGNSLGSVDADADSGNDGETVSFSYSGTAQVITATLNGSQAYLHSLVIDNSAEATVLDEGMTEVWDFGAEQLSTDTYVNMLDDDAINAWYGDDVTAGTAGVNLPDFTADELSWTGKSTSDRLRTSNENLTRYDSNISSDCGYAGRIYVNASAVSSRYLSLTLLEDDEVTIVAASQNGNGILNFVYVADEDAQTDQVSLSDSPVEYDFVAKSAGVYHVYDTQDKPSYYRVYRKNADYVTVSGSLDVTAATNIPDGYTIIFTNEAGKAWTATPSDGSYSINLPSGYSYALSLGDANGYVISSATSLDVSADLTTNITISAVELYTMSGSITGFSGSEISDLGITFTSTDESTVYIPEITIDTDNSVYTVDLESGVSYEIAATGVNDYTLSPETAQISEATTQDFIFTAKTTYPVTITSDDLTDTQMADMTLTFTNLNEDGYSYDFSADDITNGNVALRDGTYSVECSGLDSYPVEQALTSNLVVEGAAVSKTISFDTVSDWTFTEDYISGATAYKGLVFDGSITIRGGSGNDMVASAGATIKIPVSSGDKVIISDYYAAAYTIDDETTVTDESGSTSTITKTEYQYSGTEDGYVTLAVTSTSYFTEIAVVAELEYTSTLYVGTDKEFTTINDALDAVESMVRDDDERVTIEIDPGNYEEMLVVDVDNVTLTNASSSPSIALSNNGVDIDEEAVRITSYYGHGYNYYSMGDDQKWHSDVLEVNKANGYLSTENTGSGTTNGSYWNATVVIKADGFRANNIIFENSFNQYISAKEADDVVEEWTSGGKGTRPTTEGDITVQEKDYVERAAALAIASGDKTILNNCRVVGHQDSFYGKSDSRVAIYKGEMMGGTDYIFGGMVSVFYKTDLALTTSDNSNDVAYITAAQQTSGRGYLMYKCNVVSATPGTDINSTYDYSKPGYFGRPWAASTSEVVFYETNIAACQNSGYSGESLIVAEGWSSSLSGESAGMCEYQTVEEASGVDNSSSRVSWATTSATATTLSDGTGVTLYNFTKGTDGWNPFADYEVDEGDATGIDNHSSASGVSVYSYQNEVVVTNVTSETTVTVYNLSGELIKSVVINDADTFTLPQGYYIIKVQDASGTNAVKVLIY